MPRSLAAAGVARDAFEVALPALTKNAFSDASLRTNPRIPLIRELADLLQADTKTPDLGARLRALRAAFRAAAFECHRPARTEGAASSSSMSRRRSSARAEADPRLRGRGSGRNPAQVDDLSVSGIEVTVEKRSVMFAAGR